MPLCQAAAATGGGGMLRYKYRVAAHWRLFTVVFRVCRRKATIDKIARMAEDYRHAFVGKIVLVFRI